MTIREVLDQPGRFDVFTVRATLETGTSHDAGACMHHRHFGSLR